MRELTGLSVPKLCRTRKREGQYMTQETATATALRLIREEIAKEIREECATIALEQRCERGNGWDLACVTIAAAIRASNGETTK